MEDCTRQVERGLSAESVLSRMAVVHEAEAMLFSESAQHVESNGKRGFICRENTLRDEIKYHAAER